ncbi:MAG: DUF177 domain-containing protein [Elusimicrobia bacterium]|nr:DUF177 domain-containing protein [Elusimicrobiota bacterium]
MSALPADLRFKVADIVEQGGFAAAGPVAWEALNKEPVPGAVPAGPLEAALEFSVGTDALLLSGSVSGAWAVVCSRCLVPHAAAYSAAVEETFPTDAEEIDASGAFREAALLEVPQRSLCRPDCRGLCPTCGKNLNEAPCGCVPEKGSPFEVLKRLKEH